MRLAALFSGGKDSTYALYWAQQTGHEVVRLVTLLPQADSWMYHVPNVRWTALQATALGIPQLQEAAGSGEEAELRALQRVLERVRTEGAEGLVVGAIASDYQFTRVGTVCEAVGLRTMAPLWRQDPARLLEEYVEAGFEVLIVSASAEGMDETWLGRRLDEAACEGILELGRRYGVHPAGEGGEFETLVLDGPNFAQRLEVGEQERVWEGKAGTLQIHNLRLVEKTRKSLDPLT